jgi:hypothetical protein
MGSASLPRLRACADRVAELTEARRAEMDRRDELIGTVRDEGASWKDTATAARLAPSRCAAILADR